MGALDDAIRDHLELKRKHGASEEEIREREREALGPGGPAFEALGTKPQPEPASELPGAQTESQALEDELLEEMEAADGAAAAVEAPATSGNINSDAPEHAHEQAAGRVEIEPDEVLPEETLEPDRLQPEEAPAAREPIEPVGERDRTERGEEGRPAEDDPLDDVPGFLQENPEQDRLWFEQRPPKDFDFDD